MYSDEWSKRDKAIAREAFATAYERECKAIAEEARRILDSGKTPEDLWRLHDYLTKQRREADEKYDYRYSVLEFVFARLLREGWLKKEDLATLSDEKRERLRLFDSLPVE